MSLYISHLYRLGILAETCVSSYRGSCRPVAEFQPTPSAVRVYVATLVELWHAQVEAGVNNFPTPRCKPVISLLQALKDTKHAASKLAYHDRGISEYYSSLGSCACVSCLP